MVVYDIKINERGISHRFQVLNMDHVPNSSEIYQLLQQYISHLVPHD